MSMVVASPPPKSAAMTSSTAMRRTSKAATNTSTTFPRCCPDPSCSEHRRAAGRAARWRRTCRAGCSGCRTWATGRTTGTRPRRRTTQSPRGWPAATPRRRRKPRSANPAPPGWPSWTKTVSRAGVGVQRRGHAADVPAVAGREQRQQPDGGVLGRVRGARQVGLGEPDSVEHVRGQGPPHGGGLQGPLRQVERLLADHLAARGDRALQERDDLVGHTHVAQGSAAPAPQATASRSPRISMSVTSRAEVE